MEDLGLGPCLTDGISVGVLAGSVPREVIDVAVAQCGKQARRSGGKLPPHVVVYFVMAMALFADEDYAEVAEHLTAPLAAWGCWDGAWDPASTSAITQARARLGSEVLRRVFEQVATPVAELLTRGAELAGRHPVSIDGMTFDVPDSRANAAEFGYGGGSATPSAFPQVRAVTLVETATRAVIGAELGAMSGKGSGERTAARGLFGLLGDDMILLCDAGFYGFQDWCAAAGTGAALLWRVGDTVTLPVVRLFRDGSYTSVVFAKGISAKRREQIVERARAGEDVDDEHSRLVRVVEYYIDGRADRELICLLTTITDWAHAPAGVLAAGYHERWQHEGSNDQVKTELRGPGRVLRSQSPDLVRQEIYGYLLTHHALAALICRAATEADIDPDRVSFIKAVRIARRRIADPAAFSP
jgi:hypothetical protein